MLILRHSFDNLIMRYEEPNSMARWDSPLFTIPWSDDESSLPYEELWRAITEGEVKPPNAGTVGVHISHNILQLVWSGMCLGSESSYRRVTGVGANDKFDCASYYLRTIFVRDGRRLNNIINNISLRSLRIDESSSRPPVKASEPSRTSKT